MFRITLGVLYIFIFIYENECGPVINTADGKVEGMYMDTRNENTVMAFLSIPYAKPPINELRFKDPVPIEPWSGIYKAVNEIPVCPQKYLYSPEALGTEDCLYLNVYSTQLPWEPYKALPVLVVFHIGGLITGAAKNEWYGPNYLLDKDIILVTTNFRIGPFGFLSTQDDVVPGNMGMKDQVLALKWVQKNIAKFGGDPNSVTILGQSAPHYHVVSPMSKGLFHRAIMHSGSVFCPWSINYKAPKEQTITIAKSFNCPTNNSEQMIECLRKIDAHDIINRRPILQPWNMQPVNVFQTVVEHDHPNAFLSEEPRKLIMENKINSASYIMGITADDGSLSSAFFFEHPELLDEFLNYSEVILPVTLGIKDVNTKEVKDFYFNGKEITNNSIQEFTDLYTDGIFGAPLVEVVQLHKKYGTAEIYIFDFDYNSNHSTAELFGIPLNKYGSTHTDDIFYLFPFKLADLSIKTLNDNDNKLIDVMTELWVNFMKTGKPTLGDKVVWNPVEENNLKYLHIKNADELNMEDHFMKEKANFWICQKNNCK